MKAKYGYYMITGKDFLIKGIGSMFASYPTNTYIINFKRKLIWIKHIRSDRFEPVLDTNNFDINNWYRGWKVTKISKEEAFGLLL